MSTRTLAPLALAAALAALAVTCGPGSGPAAGTPAKILSILPHTRGPGDVVTIAGEEFELDPSLMTIKVGGSSATILALTSHEAVIRIPSGVASGMQVVDITTPGGTSRPLGYNIGSSATTGPSVTAIEPRVSSVGKDIVIRGSDFSSTPSRNVVTLGGLTMPVTAATPSRLDVFVPAYAKTDTVVVSVDGRGSNAYTLFVAKDTSTTPTGSGYRAEWFLDDSTYEALVVEVDWVAGKAPGADAIARLGRMLRERCDKPRGITIVLDDAIPSPGHTRWSKNDQYFAELAHRDIYEEGNTASLYFLYVDGVSDQNQGSSMVLGMAYTGSSVAMFKDSIDFMGGSTEWKTILHEAGHALGMVGKLPMVTPHQEPGGTAHDKDKSCLMYYSSTQSGDRLCSHCLDDMRAGGGR